jgi:hypothetical protein
MMLADDWLARITIAHQMDYKTARSFLIDQRNRPRNHEKSRRFPGASAWLGSGRPHPDGDTSILLALKILFERLAESQCSIDN